MKRTVEECTKLNIFELRRDGALSRDERDDYLHGNGLEIPLTRTLCNFGGFRWWFICPQCWKRVAVLYRPPRRTFFLCRHCHELTYESCQEHRTSFEPFSKRLKISDRVKKIYAGEGRKGFSKRELSQLAKLMNKIRRLPEFPPRPKIVYKRVKKR